MLDISSKSFIFFEFCMQQKQIAKDLCVKRAIKGNHCNGKCFLMRQMQKDSQRDHSTTSKEKNEINFFDQANNSKLAFQLQVDYIYFPMKEDLPVSFLDSLFRPPQTV